MLAASVPLGWPENLERVDKAEGREWVIGGRVTYDEDVRPGRCWQSAAVWA